MNKYQNLGGNSNVIAYEIGQDYIIVQFSDLTNYVYTYQVTGVDEVEHLKLLAIKGVGLNAYITKYIKGRYSDKYK